MFNQVAHLDNVGDAPVLGPTAHVVGVAHKGFRLVHALMLHPSSEDGPFSYDGGSLEPGWRNWQTHGT